MIFFKNELEMEQEYLLLSKEQRKILEILIRTGERFNAFKLRMEIYADLVGKYIEGKATLLEVKYRKEAKKQKMNGWNKLPSNNFLLWALTDLVKQGLVEVKEKKTTKEYFISPDYLKKWRTTRNQIINRLEKEPFYRKALTDLSIGIWQLENLR